MSDMSMFFMSLIAESLDLPPSAFEKFFDKEQQHKLKCVKYPDRGDGVGQGVGPHKDSMLTSYLLQVFNIEWKPYSSMYLAGMVVLKDTS